MTCRRPVKESCDEPLCLLCIGLQVTNNRDSAPHLGVYCGFPHDIRLSPRIDFELESCIRSHEEHTGVIYGGGKGYARHKLPNAEKIAQHSLFVHDQGKNITAWRPWTLLRRHDGSSIRLSLTYKTNFGWLTFRQYLDPRLAQSLRRDISDP